MNLTNHIFVWLIRLALVTSFIYVVLVPEKWDRLGGALTIALVCSFIFLNPREMSDD
jgi:hypothetical protein